MRDKSKYKKAAFYLLITGILIFNCVITIWIVIRYPEILALSPSAINRINLEANREKIDKHISSVDVEEIRKVAREVSSHSILEIKYYDCSKKIEEKKINIGPKNSQKCQPGDIFLKVGKSYFCGSLCGGGYEHYYLLRKIQDKWEIIEDLGEVNWIS